MGTADDDQPFFRFNPNAYEHAKVFEPSTEVCESCARPCVWKYLGGIYAEKEPTVCARCIADGSLANLLGDDRYTLQDVELAGAGQEFEREVLQRTPGVACFNPFEWPVLDAKPMAFIGYGEDERLIAIPAVRTAMESAFAQFGWDFGPSPYALIFREVDGDRYQIEIDLD